MGIPLHQFREMTERVERNKLRAPVASAEACERETGSDGLHAQIMRWCDSQWPRWKYIHSRTDKRSTVDPGVPDFAVFGPYPRCIVVECKSKSGKLSTDQQNWIAEMKMIGWTVNVVWNLEEFLGLTK